MGYEDTTTAPPAPETTHPSGAGATPEPRPETPPVSADARAKAAERARKHRALKKLKSAKSEKQFKTLAAEVGAEPTAAEAAASSWPTGEEIGKAAAQLAPAIEQGMELLKGTPWELGEKKAQILLMCVAPAAAQAAKNPGASALAQYVSPGVVAVVGLLAVFGPPTIREIRALVEPSPAIPVPAPPPNGGQA